MVNSFYSSLISAPLACLCRHPMPTQDPSTYWNHPWKGSWASVTSMLSNSHSSQVGMQGERSSILLRTHQPDSSDYWNLALLISKYANKFVKIRLKYLTYRWRWFCINLLYLRCCLLFLFVYLFDLSLLDSWWLRLRCILFTFKWWSGISISLFLIYLLTILDGLFDQHIGFLYFRWWWFGTSLWLLLSPQ